MYFQNPSKFKTSIEIQFNLSLGSTHLPFGLARFSLWPGPAGLVSPSGPAQLALLLPMPPRARPCHAVRTPGRARAAPSSPTGSHLPRPQVVTLVPSQLRSPCALCLRCARALTPACPHAAPDSRAYGHLLALALSRRQCHAHPRPIASPARARAL